MVENAGTRGAVGEIEQTIEIGAVAKRGLQWEVVAIIRTAAALSDIVLFSIDDRGEIVLADEFRRRPAALAPIHDIFPLLPPALEYSGTWDGQIDELGRVLRFRQAAAAQTSLQFRFEQGDPTGVSGFLRQSASGSIWFNTDTQLVTRFERTEADNGERREIRGELVGRDRPIPNRLSQNARERESLSQALRMEAALIDEITARPDKAELTLIRLDRIWSEYLAQPPRDDLSPFRQFAAARRERLRRQAAAQGARARMAEPWLGKPAAQWSFQDERGQTVTSEALRKGITVEIFWSCASEASLRMFGVALALSKELPKTSASVVFLNIDSDLSAARRAVGACGQGNRVVFAGLPMEGQAPSDLPIIRILDDQGVIRRVLFGWRPSLADAVQAVRDGR